MPRLPAVRVFLGIVSLTLFAGCQSAPPDPLAGYQRNSAAAEDWIQRRAAELQAAGLSPADARVRASQDWSARSPGESGVQTFKLYDSAAREKAEQEKVSQGLRDAQRGP